MLKKTMPGIILILLLFFLNSATENLKAQENGKTIDKIIAIIGDNIILHSDIENQYMQYLMQGETEDSGIRCEIFEELMFQKMLLNKAEKDSITISSSQVNSELDRRMRYFIRQIGSERKLEEYYNKTIIELKEELRSSIREQMLVNQVQNELTSDISITPSEVTRFFNTMPEDSLPSVPEQFKISEITVVPEVSHEDKVKIKKKLQDLRERIINGSSFKILAGLYSEDPGSADNGGETGMFTRGEMFPEFENAAFNLKEGEISPIVETEAGFHIIKLIEKQGDYINARHILLRKKVSPEKLMEANQKADSIKQLILREDTLDFLKAAKQFSDTYEQTSAGIMMNQQTGSITFSPDQMEQKLYFTVNKLNEGDISEPFQTTTASNQKGIRILKILEKSEPHRANLKEDYHRIKKAALEEKKRNILQEWINKKAGETFIKITEDKFLNCDYNYNWFE
ncbi:MAG: peptidylprolyl isomerase [Bacteroidales bacterium]